MKKLLLLLSLSYSLSAFAFDTWWHAECTRKAMVANGFSADARLATQVSNYFTDYIAVYHDKLKELGVEKLNVKTDMAYKFMHFDAIFTNNDIEQNWKLLYNNTVNALRNYASANAVKPGFRLIIFYNIIGASLHTVQDFYSHSNWVNIHQSANGAAGVIPIWYDKTEEERTLLKLATGAYPDGSVPGKLSHSDLNKDCSTRPFNKEAVETAERASIDWVKRLMEAVPELPWGELKAYNIQKDVVMKRFLVSLDATFLTSSSIVAGHFDGADPAKYVFEPTKDKTKEKAKAAAALALTINQYDLNIRMTGNENNLPSPYWAGFMIYHIVHDIAAGLKLGKENYKPPLKEMKNK